MKLMTKTCLPQLLGGLICCAIGCTEPEQAAPQSAAQLPTSASPAAESDLVADLGDPEELGVHDMAPADLEQGIQQFCGACHVLPQAENFPKSAWADEVDRGYDFYEQFARLDLTPPPQGLVQQYFEQRAPEQLPEAAHGPQWVPDGRFQAEDLTEPTREIPQRPDSAPAVSFIEAVDPGDPAAGFWLSDMRNGVVLQVAADARRPTLSFTDALHPVSVRTADLDQDGRQDLIMADLASFLPEDHRRGGVIVRPAYAEGTADAVSVLQNVGRVSDVRPLDYDGDGDSDLVVAEFGWHRTGGVHLLINETPAGAALQFRHQQLDQRPGAIHVPVLDLNADGRPDFAALFSQEHESIVAFLNTGNGFRQQVLYAAPDPAWGSSGMEFTDLDQDGDQDILYTNGDTFDSFLIKPYHGLTWLQNQGDLNFVPQSLLQMPGVHRALPVDLDGDGDLDVAVVALLPAQRIDRQVRRKLMSVVWLEQTDPGRFETHLIERGTPDYACLSVADVDADGDPDLLVGRFHEADAGRVSWIRLFRNQMHPPAAEQPAGQGE